MTDPSYRFQIRVLCGPLSGAIYPVLEQLEVGRTSVSDIQLVGRGVSRQHAVVMATEAGGHVLVDMLSTNGTWSGGQRVDRLELCEGIRFTIDDTEFVYERGSPGVIPPPVRPPIADEARSTRETAEFGGPRVALHPTAAAADTMQAPVVGRQQHGGARTLFAWPDGSPYTRNLLADIVIFRNLRLKMVRAGGGLSQQIIAQFRELDSLLRTAGSTGDERREFVRFGCELPGTLRLEKEGDRRFDVVVADIAVDGARLRAPGLTSNVNALTWLSLPLIGEGGLRCIVFTGRVAWIREDQVGLVFAGAPSWASRNKDREQERTQPLTPVGKVELKKTAPE